MFSIILYLYRNSGRRKWESVPPNAIIITDFTHVDKKCLSLSWEALSAKEGLPACLFHKLLYNSRRVQLGIIQRCRGLYSADSRVEPFDRACPELVERLRAGSLGEFADVKDRLKP
jgi:hypothetical protein